MLKQLKISIINYIIHLEENHFCIFNLRLAAIYLFFTMNDVIINRKKLGRYLGEHVKTVKDRAYIREEIKKYC